MTTPQVGSGLALVTVATPKRRIDVALPDGALVAELLPHLVRHAGEEAANDGGPRSGWVLRRSTGTVIDATRTLAMQGVRDGEILQLVPRRLEWPELAYDDVVELIANGARRTGPSWGAPATRRGGLAFGALAFTLGLGAVMVAGPPWGLPSAAALATALLLSIAGLVLSRAASDAVAGSAVAGAALPYAWLGGALLAAPAGPGLPVLGAPGMLLGSGTLLLVSVVGYTGVAAVRAVFTTGLLTSLAGLIGGLLCLGGMSSAGAAAVVLTIVLGLLPSYPLIAGWLGRLPVPDLPERPEEILEDRPVPGRAGVFAAVSRATELLTGMLVAVTLVGGCASVLLLAHGSSASRWLVATATCVLLLRARLFSAPQQRIPLLLGGAFGAALLIFDGTTRAESTLTRLLLFLLVLVTGAVVMAAGLIYSKRRPSPYVGRIADISDVLAIMALVPVAAAVIGVYERIQAAFASLGG